AVLQNFEKTNDDAEPVVSNRACELTEGNILSSRSQRDTDTSATRTPANNRTVEHRVRNQDDVQSVVSHRACELTAGNMLSRTTQRHTNSDASPSPAYKRALKPSAIAKPAQICRRGGITVVSNRACELSEGNILSSRSQRDTDTSATRTPAKNVALQNFEKMHEDAEPVVSKFFSDEFFAFFFAEKKKVPVRHEDEELVRGGNKKFSVQSEDIVTKQPIDMVRQVHHDIKPNTYATRTPANNAALKGLAIAKPAPICRRGGTTVLPNRACELSEGNIFSGEFMEDGSFLSASMSSLRSVWTLLRSNCEAIIHANEKPTIMDNVSCPACPTTGGSGIEDGKPVRRERRCDELNGFHTTFPSLLHLLLPTIFVSVFIVLR